MNRPLTPTEAACIQPLLQRLQTLNAQKAEVELGLAATVSAILGQPTEGAQLTSIDGRLVVVTPETPEEAAAKVQQLIDQQDGA